MTAPLLERQRDDIRYLCLNRVERRNALSADLVHALEAAMADAMADPATSIVVIRGAGPTFCSGADLGHLHALAVRGKDPMPYLTAIGQCFDHIEQSPKPVVAAIHGHAVAGGLELALACDVIVAEAGTLVGDGHVRRGLLPAGGSSVRLPRKVGAALARWMILTGELLTAETLHQAGLIHAIARSGELDGVVSAVLPNLRGADVTAQRNSKVLLSQQARLDDAAKLDLERAHFAHHWHQNDLGAHLAGFAADRSCSRDGRSPWAQPDTPAAS